MNELQKKIQELKRTNCENELSWMLNAHSILSPVSKVLYQKKKWNHDTFLIKYLSYGLLIPTKKYPHLKRTWVCKFHDWIVFFFSSLLSRYPIGLAIKGLGIRRILGRLKKKLISMRPRKLPVSLEFKLEEIL